MPRHALLPLLAVLAAGQPTPCPAEPEACAGVTTEGAEVEAVRQQELRGARMNVDGWAIAESRDFFAPDFVAIQPGGQVNDLEAIMRTLADGRSPGWARSFDLTGLDIRVVDCATAIVVGTAEARALNGPAGSAPWRVRFLNVWRKEGGRWLYWANQFTPITTDVGQVRPIDR